MTQYFRDLSSIPSTYHAFVLGKSETASWVQYLCLLTATHPEWLRVVKAYRANLETGMIESEAAYHALTYERDAVREVVQ